jgi:anaerobic selenocysteine-containing dehydrogenase
MEQRLSSCPLDCPDACGLTVTVDNGRVVEVEGDQRSPLTGGFICGKVRKIADHVHGDARVLHPMIRAGAKGTGQWRQASWEEALELVGSRIAAIRARAGGEAILPFHYGGSNGWLTEGALATRFFRRLGASNLERTYCAAAFSAATEGMYGKVPGTALEDYEHANLVVLWGVNPSATGIHLVPVIERAKERGAKLVVLDPRRTPLARRADLHIPLRPGTDLPVALAIINALFERDHADLAFLDAHAARVDELRARASGWSLDAAAREASVDVAALDRFVELYAASSPAALRLGYGLERNRNGGSAVCAVLAIPAVAGKLGVRGGGFTTSNGSGARWTVTAETAIEAPKPPTRTINMSELGRVLARTDNPRIECLFVYNCNPVTTAPDQRTVIEQLSRDDVFVVVHEQVWTDTCQLADVVLPATTFLEHRELTRGYGNMRMYDSPPVIPAVGEARSNNELFGALLRKLALVQPGDAMTDDELVAKTFDASEHGVALRAQLADHHVATPPGTLRPVLFADVFPTTPDGKVHLVPEALDREANGLYTYKPDPRTAAYPLALISPALSTQISSYFGQLRKEPATLDLSPADAAARGIKNGDAIRVWNDQAEMRCLARITTDLQEGVCLMPKGLWRKHSRNGFTSNALIPPAFADLAGQAAWNDARVQVAKNDQSE